MWTRRELKARARAAFKANYWKCVLVALILVLMSSAAGSGPRSNVCQTEEIDEFSADQQYEARLAAGTAA